MLAARIQDRYGLDLAAEYAGKSIPLPFGKASGQLSLNPRQVRADAAAGLAFVVLKTVIAEDEQGRRSMADWALPESRMRVEPIIGADGEEGWTVTWRGRGWSGDLASYVTFLRRVLEEAQESGLVAAPSVKYHLPGPREREFLRCEYDHTTSLLARTWLEFRSDPMPLEKDLSPTLAGDERSREQERILEWLRRVPALIREGSPHALTLGVKLMNARFDLDFQVEMVRTVVDESGTPPDFLVYANRLFDPQRTFDGASGVAYGGPDLRRRNLAALAAVRSAAAAGRIARPLPAICGTGDILSGRAAAEYGLAGAMSCQLHTLFQLPDRVLGGPRAPRPAMAMRRLLFHPRSGLLATLLGLSRMLDRTVHWRDLPRLGRVGMAALAPAPAAS